MSELRFSVDDLMTALRGRDIFDISEVQFAIVETTGSISIMKKAYKDTPTREDLNIPVENADPPQVVVSDGKVMKTTLKSLGFNEQFVKNISEKSGVKITDIFIMAADSSGNCFISQKSDKSPIKIEGSQKDDKN